MSNSRRVAIVGTPLALAGLLFLATGPDARADTGPPTTAGPVAMSAQAVALQTVYQSLNVPFGLPFAVGSYGASANVDAGGATSDAGAPYSPLVSSLPSAGNGVASTMGYQLPVVPTFPGYVSAQYPNRPVADQNAGMYQLTATTGASEAEGKVSMGGEKSISEKNNLFAIAHTVSKDATTTVDADAGAVALTLPGILDLFNTSSQIHVVRNAEDAHPTFAATTSLGTITFAGTTSGMSGNTPQVAGAKGTPINFDTLPRINKALEPSGVSLNYLPESYIYTDGTYSTGDKPAQNKTVRGLTSGALQMIYHKDVQGQGPTTETITIGQVSVTADGGSAAPPATAAAPATTGRADTTPAAGAPVTDQAALPAALPPDAQPPTLPLGEPAPAAPQRSDTVALAQSQSPSGVRSIDQIRAQVARLEKLNFSLDDTYPLVVVVGAAMLVGSVLTRLLGGRLISLRRS